MDEFLQLGKEVLASQPFSVWVGADLTAFSPGHAELTIPITDHLKQQFGFVHGGVISYAADNALSFVAGSVLGPAILISEYKINYLRPALGEALIARASVVSVSRTQAVCRCEVYAQREGQEDLCAAAQGTIVRTGRGVEEQADR